MSMTTCQKVTLLSCSILCISLFLPTLLLPSRGKKDAEKPEVGPGYYPPMMHRLPKPEGQDQWGVEPQYPVAHSPDMTAGRKGSKSGLMAQVIPIYGFSVLLYIIYIIFKMTTRGKTAKRACHFPTLTSENIKNKITDYELARLQERVRETERMMERIVSGKGHAHDSGKRRRSKGSSSKQEEKLLRQLKEMNRVLQENHYEAVTPEMEAEQTPYAVEWEGYPEETYPEEQCESRTYNTIVLEVPAFQPPTPEALAEQMEAEEEEEVERKLDVVQEEDEDCEEEEEEEEEEDEERVTRLLCLPLSPRRGLRREERLGLEVSRELQSQRAAGKRISFSEYPEVYHYHTEGPEEDPEGADEEGDLTDEEETEEEEEEEEIEVQEVVEKKQEEEEEEEEDEEDIEDNDPVIEVDVVDEEDPVMEAESLVFGAEVCCNPEAEAEEDKEEDEEYLLLSLPEDSLARAGGATDSGTSGLRMRNRRET